MMHANAFDDLVSESLATGRRLVLWLLAIGLLGYAGVAFAAPRAQSGEECFLATDMLLTARALAESGLSEARLREVLGRMYAAPHLEKWAGDLVRYALSAKASAKDTAGAFYTHCTANQGRVDGFLGVAL
jgi:hypothetical protein